MVGTYSGAVMRDTPSAYWRLGDSGGTARDLTDGHPGAATGDVSFGKPGALRNDSNTAVCLNGTNGKIDPDTGEAFGRGESTFTFSVHVTFTDGTRDSIHEVGHVLFDANGVVKVEFDKVKAHCG